MRFDFGLLKARHDLTPKQFRASGIVILVLAAIILALVLLLTAALLVMGLNIEIPASLVPDGMRIDREEQAQAGSPGLFIFMGIFLTVLFAYGILALMQGVWQIMFASRNERVMKIMVWIVFAVVVAGAIASLAMGRMIGRVGQ